MFMTLMCTPLLTLGCCVHPLERLAAEFVFLGKA
jgi:hypothetical protein